MTMGVIRVALRRTRRRILITALLGVAIWMVSGTGQAYAWKAGAHWATAMKIQAALPADSRIKAAMIAQPNCVAWGSNGPDLTASLPYMAFDRVPWFDTYHYHSCGTYAAQLLRNALASNDDRQIAFAAGWLSHIIGDMAVHGELVNPEAGVYIDWNSDHDLHGLLEGYADTIVWQDPSMGNGMAGTTGPTLLEPYSGSNETQKLYRLFTSGQNFGTLQAPPKGVLEGLVDRTNKQVILDPQAPYGGFTHLQRGTAASFPTWASSPGWWALDAIQLQSGDYFGPNNMRQSMITFAEVVAHEKLAIQDPTAMQALIGYIRGKANMYKSSYSSYEAIPVGSERFKRIQRAWTQSIEDSAILLEAAEAGDYSQFSDTWVADKGVDSRPIGSMNVVVITGKAWRLWNLLPDGPGTNHNVYFGMQAGTQTKEWKLEHLGYDDFESGDRDIYYLNPPAWPVGSVDKIWIRLGTDQYGVDLPYWDMYAFAVEMNGRCVYATTAWDHWTESGTRREARRTDGDGLLSLAAGGWPVGNEPWLRPIRRPIGVNGALQNVDFELEGKAWNGAGSGSFSYERSSEVTAGRGPGRVKVACSSSDPMRYYDVFQNVRVVPGQRYGVSALALRGSMTDSPPFIGVTFNRANGTPISETVVPGIGVPRKSLLSATNFDWKRISVVATAPADAEYMTVRLRAVGEPHTWPITPGATAYFDNVQVMGDEPHNTSFESWSAGLPDAWDHVAKYIIGAPGGALCATSPVAADRCSAKVVNAHTSTSSYNELLQEWSGETGKTYHMNIAAASNQPDKAVLRLEFLAGNGVTIMATETAGTRFGVNAVTQRRMTVFGMAPPGTALVRVRLQLKGGPLPAGAATRWVVFDDLRVTKGAVSAVSLKLSRSTVKSGVPLTAQVMVRDVVTGSPLAGFPVAIEGYYSGAWRPLSSLVSSQGVASAAVAPPFSMLMRARFMGTPNIVASTSGAARVVVSPAMSTPSVSSSPKRGALITNTIILSPRHSAGSRPVKFTYQHYESGKWVTRRTTTGSAADYMGTSKCTARVRLYYRGAWRVRTTHAADTLNPLGVSAWRSFRVY